MAVTSPSKSGEVRARALYDFVAEREEELSLKVVFCLGSNVSYVAKAGDVVIVVDDSDIDGWWEAMKVTKSKPGNQKRKMAHFFLLPGWSHWLLSRIVLAKGMMRKKREKKHEKNETR
jgi:hypothetical protein